MQQTGHEDRTVRLLCHLLWSQMMVKEPDGKRTHRRIGEPEDWDRVDWKEIDNDTFIEWLEKVLPSLTVRVKDGHPDPQPFDIPLLPKPKKEEKPSYARGSGTGAHTLRPPPPPIRAVRDSHARSQSLPWLIRPAILELDDEQWRVAAYEQVLLATQCLLDESVCDYEGILNLIRPRFGIGSRLHGRILTYLSLREDDIFRWISLRIQPEACVAEVRSKKLNMEGQPMPHDFRFQGYITHRVHMVEAHPPWGAGDWDGWAQWKRWVVRQCAMVCNAVCEWSLWGGSVEKEGAATPTIHIRDELLEEGMGFVKKFVETIKCDSDMTAEEVRQVYQDAFEEWESWVRRQLDGIRPASVASTDQFPWPPLHSFQLLVELLRPLIEKDEAEDRVTIVPEFERTHVLRAAVSLLPYSKATPEILSLAEVVALSTGIGMEGDNDVCVRMRDIVNELYENSSAIDSSAIWVNMVRAGVLEHIVTILRVHMVDYRRSFSRDPMEMEPLLMLFSIALCRRDPDYADDGLLRFPASKMVRETLTACIHASMKAQYDRISAREPRPFNTGSYLPLLDAILEEMEAEDEFFTPQFMMFLPDSQSVSYEGVLEAMKKDFNGWATDLLDSNGGGISSEDLEIISRCAKLQQHVKDSSGCVRDVLGISGKFMRALEQWIREEQERLITVMERALSLETWEGTLEHEQWSDTLAEEKQRSQSAVVLLSEFERSRRTLFRFNFSGVGPNIRAWVQVIGGVMQQYALRLAGPCSDPEILLPLEVKIRSIRDRRRQKPMPPRFFGSLVSVEEGCLRINTLEWIMGQIDGIIVRAASDWKKNPYASSADPDLALDAAIHASMEYLMTMQRRMMEWLGYRVVLIDMRDKVEKLYFPSVQTSPIGSILSNLDPVLGLICDRLYGTIVDRAIFALLRGVCFMVEAILMPGSIGPPRAFVAPDSLLLERDLSAMEDFFIADGEGLHGAYVRKETSRLRAIIGALMSSSSHVLMARYDQAPVGVDESAGPAMRRPGQSEETLWTKRNILTVLSHRDEKEVIHFVKKNAKLLFP